jgi:enoyl-CoA hydratase/carnithine racemase
LFNPSLKGQAMTYQDILYKVEHRIATITLNRPDKLNAWTAVMEREVREAMDAAAADEGVRAIVLTGAGRGFCAGADMDLLLSARKLLALRGAGHGLGQQGVCARRFDCRHVCLCA